MIISRHFLFETLVYLRFRSNKFVRLPIRN